jgi:hypothetical protein
VRCIDLGVGCLRSFRTWLAAAVSSILSPKVAEEICEGHGSVQDMPDPP